MDYRDNRQRWAESHQVVHFYAGQWCTFTPALTHGFTGGYTIVKNYVRSRRQSMREAFVPLHHPPGHAQLDFGEAVMAPPRPSSHHCFKQGDFIGRQIEQVIDDPVHFSLALCDLR